MVRTLLLFVAVVSGVCGCSKDRTMYIERGAVDDAGAPKGAGAGSGAAGESPDSAGKSGSSSSSGEPKPDGAVDDEEDGDDEDGGSTDQPEPRCMAGVTPIEETCDGTDQDCDGEVDEELSLGSCAPDGSSSDPEDACERWRLTCENGSMVCKSFSDPEREQCNGRDDDCDGTVDEDADTSCFTASAGCERTDGGKWRCLGICQAGNRSCRGGTLVGACTGQVGPSLLGERCTQTPAADDDCDGDVDEECPCSAGNMQACYTGPDATADVGTCKSGQQACALGFFGFCQGQVQPVAETCENSGQDNDCDGDANEAGEGDLCFTGEPGRCARGTTACDGDRTACEPDNRPSNEQCNASDDDCDGRTDEDFDLRNSEATCGSCFRRCSGSQQCCNGGCTATNSDAANCGQCGRACAAGQTCFNGNCRCAEGAALCGGRCVNTSTDNAHCGGCNQPCTGGRVCGGGTCQCTGDEILCDGQCVAPVCGGGCACGAGQGCCGDRCVDTRTSDLHCGGCNSPCEGDLTCISSVCGCEIGSRCGTECVNLNNDPANCGDCGRPCGEGQTCVSGACE